MVDNIKFQRVFEDRRGGICLIQFHNRIFELIELVKNAPRGGHFHNIDVTLITLSGKILYREMVEGSEAEIILESGNVHNIPAGNAHLLIGMEDSLAIEFRDQEYTTTNYMPYRHLVEDYLRTVNQ